MKRLMTVSTVLGLLVLAAAAGAEVFVYPKQGQGKAQFQGYQLDCHNWAQGQTGVNPSQPVYAAAPAPQTGGALRGGARGAALGAVGGAIGGDAGKGAAIGAGVGAVAGRMRQNTNNREAAQASQQAQAQQQGAYGNYEKAYATCLSGRGYSVK